MALDCTYSAFQFMFYEYLRKKRKEQVGRKLETWENLTCGAIAGASAGWLTNPLDVVVCRLQTQSTMGHYDGMLDCYAKIFRNEGVAAFFHGATPRMLWLTPFAGLQFATYEFFKTVLGVDI